MFEKYIPTCIINCIQQYYLTYEIFKETKSLFNTLDCIYIHFSYPSKNQRLIEMQKQLSLKILTIGRISDTRWNCRYKNCEAVIQSYQAIVNVLQEEIEEEMDKDVNEAIGIFIYINLHYFFAI